MMIIGVVRLSNSLKAADWPQWRGPERNAHSDEHLTSTDWEKNPPKHLWTVSGFGKGYASVAIVKGTLYTLGNTDGGQAVIAAKAHDGSILRKKVITDANPQHDHEGSRSTPSVDGDRLYVVTSNGFIACLKSDNGDVVWQRQFSDWGGKMMSGWGYSESPLVDGHLIFRYQDGTVALIEATPTAYHLKGSFSPDFQEGNSWAHPVVVKGKLYLREQDKLICYQVGE